MLLSDLLARDMSPVSPTGPVDPRLRRAAIAGVGAAVAVATWLWIAWSRLDGAGPRPGYFIVGWALVLQCYQLGGYGLVVLRAILIMIALAGVLAAGTSGFAYGTPLARIGIAAVAGLGLVTGVPFALVLAVCAVNLALWVLGGVLLVLVTTGLVRAYFHRTFRHHHARHHWH